MYTLKHGQWTACAVALLAGLVWFGLPSAAYADWMGPAFDQSLAQTIDQVKALIAQADQQGTNVPELDQALRALTKAQNDQEPRHRHHQHPRDGDRDGPFGNGLSIFNNNDPAGNPPAFDPGNNTGNNPAFVDPSQSPFTPVSWPGNVLGWSAYGDPNQSTFAPNNNNVPGGFDPNQFASQPFGWPNNGLARPDIGQTYFNPGNNATQPAPTDPSQYANGFSPRQNFWPSRLSGGSARPVWSDPRQFNSAPVFPQQPYTPVASGPQAPIAPDQPAPSTTSGSPPMTFIPRPAFWPGNWNGDGRVRGANDRFVPDSERRRFEHHRDHQFRDGALGNGMAQFGNTITNPSTGTATPYVPLSRPAPVASTPAGMNRDGMHRSHGPFGDSLTRSGPDFFRPLDRDFPRTFSHDPQGNNHPNHAIPSPSNPDMHRDHAPTFSHDPHGSAQGITPKANHAIPNPRTPDMHGDHAPTFSHDRDASGKPVNTTGGMMKVAARESAVAKGNNAFAKANDKVIAKVGNVSRKPHPSTTAAAKPTPPSATTSRTTPADTAVGGTMRGPLTTLSRHSGDTAAGRTRDAGSSPTAGASRPQE